MGYHRIYDLIDRQSLTSNIACSYWTNVGIYATSTFDEQVLQIERQYCNSSNYFHYVGHHYKYHHHSYPSYHHQHVHSQLFVVVIVVIFVWPIFISCTTNKLLKRRPTFTFLLVQHQKRFHTRKPHQKGPQKEEPRRQSCVKSVSNLQRKNGV